MLKQPNYERVCRVLLGALPCGPALPSSRKSWHAPSARDAAGWRKQNLNKYVLWRAAWFGVSRPNILQIESPKKMRINNFYVVQKWQSTELWDDMKSGKVGSGSWRCCQSCCCNGGWMETTTELCSSGESAPSAARRNFFANFRRNKKKRNMSLKWSIADSSN